MRLTILAIVLALPGAARADVERANPHPVPKRSTWLGVAGHAGKLGSLDEAGVGPALEFALGRRRWQYFADLGLGYAVLGPSVHRTEGVHGRAGIGVRWLARSYTMVGNGGIEMNLEAFTGVNRHWWRGEDNANEHLRMDLGFGIGWQMRFFESGTTFRTTARVYFTPERGADATDAIACRGTCSSGASISSGLAVLMGFAW